MRWSGAGLGWVECKSTVFLALNTSRFFPCLSVLLLTLIQARSFCESFPRVPRGFNSPWVFALRKSAERPSLGLKIGSMKLAHPSITHPALRSSSYAKTSKGECTPEHNQSNSNMKSPAVDTVIRNTQYKHQQQYGRAELSIRVRST